MIIVYLKYMADFVAVVTNRLITFLGTVSRNMTAY